MPWCDECERGFATYAGLNQHLENSAAHSNEQWECPMCDRFCPSEKALKQHLRDSADHPYCADCERTFVTNNSLMQHMRSSVHQGRNITCPFCKHNFVTASGLTIHLESGTCSSGLNRDSINSAIQRLDTRNVITRPLLTYHNESQVGNIATERAYSRATQTYHCYLCPRQFTTLYGLNAHMKSPVHQMDIYKCPHCSCCSTFKLLSALIMHIESERCGLMRFATVQRKAQNGIKNMVGRMIAAYE